MTCQWCGAAVADAEAVYCSRCGRPLGSDDAVVTERIEGETPTQEVPAPSTPARTEERVAETPEAVPRKSSPTTATSEATDENAPEPESADDDRPRTGKRARANTAMATELVVAARGALRSGRWPEATSAAAIGFLAVLGVGALFVAVLKLFDPTLGAGRSPLWVLTRVVIAGLASLGIPIEQVGLEGAILPMGALALVAWAATWAARTVVARSGVVTTGARVVEGLKMAPPFALMCCIAALLFRDRDGLDFGADPGMALLLGGFWAAVFGAAGGLLAGGSMTSALRSLRSDANSFSVFEEGWMAAMTMLVGAAVLSMAAALIFLIIDLTTGADVPLTAGDAIAIIFLLLVFAPNIAVGTAAFSLGAPIRFTAETFGAGFSVDYSLFGWNGAGPEWYVYLAVLIPFMACIFGGYSARRRTRNPERVFEVVGIAAGVFALALSLLVYIGALSVDRGFLGRGNLLVLAPDAAAVFFLGLLWAGVIGALGWRIADGQPGWPEPDEPARRSEVSEP
jgi:hypothetical protein